MGVHIHDRRGDPGFIRIDTMEPNLMAVKVRRRKKTTQFDASLPLILKEFGWSVFTNVLDNSLVENNFSMANNLFACAVAGPNCCVRNKDWSSTRVEAF